MAPWNLRALTVAACALAVLGGWLLVAGLIDAQHPESVVVYLPSTSTGTGSVSWWAIAAGLAWKSSVAVVLALAAAWVRTRSQASSRPLRVALIVAALDAAALAGVGAGGFVAMIADHGPIAEPNTLLAIAAFDVAVGIALTAGIFALVYSVHIAPATADPATRLLPLPIATVLLLVIALGAVMGLAEAAGSLAPQIVAGQSFGFVLAEQPPEPAGIQPQPAAPVAGGADPGTLAFSLADELAALLPHGIVDITQGCQDESLDVVGTHAPRACAPDAYVEFRPSAAVLGQAFVDSYANARELAYQYDVELRYMRQYAGLRFDTAVPGVAQARMIHTGEQGDLFAVVARVGPRLVIEFVTSEDGRALTARQLAAATKDAGLIIDIARDH